MPVICNLRHYLSVITWLLTGFFWNSSRFCKWPKLNRPEYVHPPFTPRDQIFGQINHWHCRLLLFRWQTNTLPSVKTGHVTLIMDVCICFIAVWVEFFARWPMCVHVSLVGFHSSVCIVCLFLFTIRLALQISIEVIHRVVILSFVVFNSEVYSFQ